MTTANEQPTGASRTSLLALVGWLLFVFLVIYALMVGGGYEGIYATNWRTLSLVLVAAVLLGWALFAWRRPEWRPRTAIWPALVAPLLALVLSLVLARFPRLGIEYVAWAFLLVAIYLLLARILATEFARARIGGLALILGLVVGIAYLWVVFSHWLDWWELLGRFEMPPLRPKLAGMPFGGPNIVATVAVLATVLAVAGLGMRSKGRALLIACLLVVTAAVVVVTGSRSAWLALGGASVIVGGLWLLTRRATVSRSALDRRTLALLGGGVGAVVVAAIVLGPTLLDRLVNSGDGGRPSYWAAAIRMFEDAPLTGLGPGAWAAQRLAYLQPGEVDFAVPHAHNVYLQTAAELGLVGLLAGAIAAGAIGWLIYRALRSEDRRRMTWAWAVLFGATYLALANVVSFYASLPGVLMLWLIPLALLDGLTDEGLGVPRRLAVDATGRLASLGLVLACVVSVGILGWAESSASTLDEASVAVREHRWDEAAAAAERAVEADPHPGHHLVAAIAAMGIGEPETAVRHYEAALEVDDLPHAWAGLALASLQAGGSDDDVRRHLQSAMRMGRQDVSAMVAVADVYERLGQQAEADDAMATAILLQSGLASASPWGNAPDDLDRHDAILDAVIERAGRGAWRYALAAGDAERARELLRAADAYAGTAADVVDAWDGDQAALARLQDAAEADPTDSGQLSLVASLTARSGDDELADRYRQLALFRAEGVTLLGLPLVIGERCEDGVPAPSRTEQLHGLWAYRRDLPQRLLPVGAPCLLLGEDPA